MLEIDDALIEVTEDYTYLYQGEPFTGIGHVKLDGQLIRETTYLQGAKEGLERDWDVDTGQLLSEQNFVNNVPEGLSQSWYENGQLKSQMENELGITVRRKVWDQQGNLVEDYTLEPTHYLYKLLEMKRRKP